MGDSDQPLSEYLAQPGGGGAVLPSKIQQALHDALVNALDVKSAQEVQGFGPEVFVGATSSGPSHPQHTIRKRNAQCADRLKSEILDRNPATHKRDTRYAMAATSSFFCWKWAQ